MKHRMKKKMQEEEEARERKLDEGEDEGGR